MKITEFNPASVPSSNWMPFNKIHQEEFPGIEGTAFVTIQSIEGKPVTIAMEITQALEVSFHTSLDAEQAAPLKPEGDAEIYFVCFDTEGWQIVGEL